MLEIRGKLKTLLRLSMPVNKPESVVTENAVQRACCVHDLQSMACQRAKQKYTTEAISRSRRTNNLGATHSVFVDCLSESEEEQSLVIRYTRFYRRFRHVLRNLVVEMIIVNRST